MKSFTCRLFILSSPSGGGKSTIVKALCKNDPLLCYTVSATTRSPRKGERQGIDYYFMTEMEFREKISKDCFIEWVQIHNAYYGTLWSEIKKCSIQQHKIILDIDVNGGLAIKEKIKEATLIFLHPPSINVLKHRLEKRGTESKQQLRNRLNTAKNEILIAEQYDYQLINDRLEDTIQQVGAIIQKEVV